MTASAKTADYAIHGTTASFTEGRGWVSNDGLVAKHLNRCTEEAHPNGAALEDAHAIVMHEYGPAVQLIIADSPNSPEPSGSHGE